MRFNILRSAAVTLSMMGVCSVASAQYGAPAGYGGQPYPGSYLGPPQVAPQGPAGFRPAANPQANGGQFQYPANPPAASYQSPSKWSSFGVSNNGPALFQPASTGAYDGGLPSPEMIPTPTPASPNMPSVAPMAPPSYSAPAQSNEAMSYPAPTQYGTPNHYASPTHASTPMHSYSTPAPHAHHAPADPSCSTCNQSAFAEAASQPWEGASYVNGPSCGVPMAAPVRAPLFPWFGSMDLLFFDLETNGKDRNLISGFSAADPTRPYLPAFGSGSLDPGSALGYNLSVGRYFGCGQFGLGVSYLNFDPDMEEVSLFAPTPGVPNPAPMPPGDFRPLGMPQYRGARMEFWHDNGAGAYTQYQGGAPADGVGYDDGTYQVYHIVDGQAGAHGTNDGGAADTGGAQRIRGRRDVDVQGLEVNLFSFGLMGAQRASAMGCGPGLGARLGGLFHGGYGGVGGYGSCGTGTCGQQTCGTCGPACGASCGPRFGFGGLGGPLVRPCNGKVQVVTSHGFRWFQFEDTLDFAYDVDGRVGYGENDLYDHTRVENNLFGYQFGSRLNYCVGSRVNLNVGGKFGIYGNEVEQQHRLGSLNRTATLDGMPDLAIDYDSSDTVLSTLGELDLGLGVRVTSGLTARFGYRLLGVTGIATADGYSRDYSSSANAAAIHANDSLLLHGLYVGTDFNW